MSETNKFSKNASFEDPLRGEYSEKDPLLKPSESPEPLWRQYSATFLGEY